MLGSLHDSTEPWSAANAAIACTKLVHCKFGFLHMLQQQVTVVLRDCRTRRAGSAGNGGTQGTSNGEAGGAVAALLVKGTEAPKVAAGHGRGAGTTVPGDEDGAQPGPSVPKAPSAGTATVGVEGSWRERGAPAAQGVRGGGNTQPAWVGAFLDGPDKEGLTPLMWAARKGSVEGVAQLLGLGASVWVTDNEGGTALTWALQSGDTKEAEERCAAIVKALLEAHADPKHRLGKSGLTILMLAAQMGRKSIVEALVCHQKVKDTIDFTDEEGNSALLLAAEAKHADVVSSLLQAGADMEHANDQAFTALMAAAKSGHKNTLMALLGEKYKADTEAVNPFGDTALSLAALNERPEACRLLLAKGAKIEHKTKKGNTPLWLAAFKGNELSVEVLLRQGASTSAVGEDGCTPLLVAAAKGYLGTVKALLMHDRASIDGVDGQGRTALHLAVLGMGRENPCPNPDAQAVPYGYAATGLGAANTSPSSIPVSAAPPPPGNPSEHETSSEHRGPDGAIQDFTKVTDLLLDRGAALDVQDSKGATPLVYGTQRGQYSLCSKLLDKGAANDMQDKQGKTPVMYSILGGYYNVFEGLLARNGYLDLKDREGRTALHHAVSCKHWAMVRELIHKGASPTVESNAKRPPVDECESESSEAEYEFLRSYTNAAQLVETEGLRAILNGIAIVAVLIVTVTFVGLQTPPGGPSDAEGGQLKMGKQLCVHEAEIEKHSCVILNRVALRIYFILDGLSLFFAATDLLLVLSFLLPGVSKYYRAPVDQAAWVWCMLASCTVLLATALVLTVGAYVAAGFTVLPENNYWIMYVVAIAGGYGLLVALVVFVRFIFGACPHGTAAFILREVLCLELREVLRLNLTFFLRLTLARAAVVTLSIAAVAAAVLAGLAQHSII